ncbi:PQQ-binding-like beta-propeller repeat protein [Candidatus Micrarchaeota archaeon]|nr:PQQ-binding-like beta-propeller repeat protein [Candidatus Micrarchaeota archaeon]
MYFGTSDGTVYQLNVSNISQQIATFTTGASVTSSPAIANGYLYVGSTDFNIYQLNASNISQQIANFTTGGAVYSSPAVGNGYVYVGSDDGVVYQLNASNISLLTDSIAPVTSLVSPANNTNTTNTTVYLTFNTTDNAASTMNCSLFVNDAYNQSNASTVNATSTTFTLSSLSQGRYNWLVQCADTVENTANSSSRNFTVDTTAPNVSLSSPVNNTNTTNTTVYLTFNETENLFPTVNCSLFFNGAYNQSNSSNLNATTTKFNVTNLSDGHYGWLVQCNDSAGNAANSTARNFTVDTTSPFVSFSSPTPSNGSSQSNSNIYVNLSSSDSYDHYAFSDFDSSLKLWLTMDSINGSYDPVDSSSYASNGTAFFGAAQTTDGRFGKGFSFNGVFSYISVPRPVEDNFTICAWINTTSTGSSLNHWQTAAVFESEAGGPDYDFGFGTASNGKMAFGTGPADVTIIGNTTVADGIWHHVCALRNGDSGQLDIYVDGSLDAEGFSSTGSLTANSQASIGYGSDGATGLNGTIDDLLVFNRVLSNSEIFSLYDANSSQYENNFTNLSYGTHTFIGYATDQSGNTNQTETRIVTISASSGISLDSGGSNNNGNPSLTLSVSPSCTVNTTNVLQKSP